MLPLAVGVLSELECQIRPTSRRRYLIIYLSFAQLSFSKHQAAWRVRSGHCTLPLGNWDAAVQSIAL